MPVTQSGADLADSILTQLGEDFVLPSVDLLDAEYLLPSDADNKFYDPVSKINVDELTTGDVGGSGVFDKLMSSHNAHIKEEYSKGRLTGEQYSKAYIELTTAALSSSVQMVMGREQAYWQAGLAQAQIRTAEIAAVTASVELEAAKAQLAALFYQAQQAENQAALAKLQLATEEAKYKLTLEQYNQAAYTTTNILPIQKTIHDEEHTHALYTNTHILPLQKDQLVEQVAQASFITTDIQPLQKDINTEERDQAVYTTAQIQPLQKSQLEHQVAQLEYTVTSLLPAQKALVDEQGEAKRGETLDTRSDGTTAVMGMIGKQKALYNQQIDSYQKDASYKVGKLYSDSWITRLTIDDATSTPNEFDTAAINDVLATLRTNVGLNP